MAIVLPLLLLVLFGIVDFGLMLNRQLMLTEAAQQSARAAALGQDATAKAGTVFGDPPTSIEITPCADSESDATVRLTYLYDARTPLFDEAFELHATGVMACAG